MKTARKIVKEIKQKWADDRSQKMKKKN